MTHHYLCMFTVILMTGSLISISSNSWFGMWLGLEINLLAFIPLIQSKNNPYSTESSLKYFIIQTIASSIFMFSMIYMMKFNLSVKNIENTMILILNSSLLLKIGMAPFHFWFPEISEGLNWNNCFIMLSWQKLTPMVLFMYNLNYHYYIFIIVIANMLIASISSFNQSSLRKILMYSSMNHMSWMISSMLFSEKIWFFYWMIYTILTLNILLFFKIFNIYFFNQLISSSNKNVLLKILFTLNILSLGGLPPFIGFYPKWLTIHYLIQFNWIFMLFLMILFTMLMLFIYLRLILHIFSLMNFEIKYIFNFKQEISLFTMLNILSMFALYFWSLNSSYL